MTATESFAAGLSGIKIFVRPDERPAFEDLKLSLAQTLVPRTAHECHLFDLVLSAAWNVRRVVSLEAELQNEADSLGFADAFCDDELAKKLDRLNRYKRQYETSYRRAMAELKQLTAARQPIEPSDPSDPAPQPAREPIVHQPIAVHVLPSETILRPESPRGS